MFELETKYYIFQKSFVITAVGGESQEQQLLPHQTTQTCGLLITGVHRSKSFFAPRVSSVNNHVCVYIYIFMDLSQRIVAVSHFSIKTSWSTINRGPYIFSHIDLWDWLMKLGFKKRRKVMFHMDWSTLCEYYNSSCYKKYHALYNRIFHISLKILFLILLLGDDH